MVAVVWAALYLSEPYKYAMTLTQTHVLFVFLSVWALVLARRRQYVWAGVLLAVAASVKITPAFLLLYWLVDRRWLASLSFAASSLVLAIVTVAVSGHQFMAVFLRSLSTLSNMLLVSWNNESLAAFWMSHSYPVTEQYVWNAGGRAECRAADRLLRNPAHLARSGRAWYLDLKPGHLDPGDQLGCSGY